MLLHAFTLTFMVLRSENAVKFRKKRKTNAELQGRELAAASQYNILSIVWTEIQYLLTFQGLKPCDFDWIHRPAIDVV